jgi:predicted nucleic acid-binding protein
VILLDTSAIYALASRNDVRHQEAVKALARAEGDGQEFLVHTYVLVESFALVHRRHGFAAAQHIDGELTSVLTVSIDRPLHDRAIAWLRAHPDSHASLVDAVSFVVMQERGLEEALAFDPDFERAGFRLYR